MKTSIISTITAAAILASASTFAYAATDNDNKRGGKHRGPNIERMLEKLDTNKDGGISLEEVQTSHAELFAKVDANNDSSLTEEEFGMIKELKKAERDAKRAANATSTDTGTDAASDQTAQSDKDGKRKGKHAGKRGGKHGGKHGGKKGPSFDRLDADSSGSVTLTEFTGQADKMFERMDRNSDGVINADDMKRNKS